MGVVGMGGGGLVVLLAVLGGCGAADPVYVCGGSQACVHGPAPQFFSFGNMNYRDTTTTACNDARCCVDKHNGPHWGNFYTNSEPSGVTGLGPTRWRQLKRDTLAQEGRSFCIAAEQINASQLAAVAIFKDFAPLLTENFDIGNHIRPGASAKMNIYTPIKLTPGDSEAYCDGKLDSSLYENRPAFEDVPSPHCKNPYRVEVTEIDAHMTRLHNYLHIKVFAENIATDSGGAKNCPLGKIRYLMLEVRDSLGFQVGHFTNEVPCDSGTGTYVASGPKSIPGQKYVGTKKNAIPCMYAQKKAVSHPGIFLAAAGSDSGEDYFTEVHATWRFAQHTSNFISELHFVALIVEDIKPLRYFTGRLTKWSAKYCYYWEKWLCHMKTTYDARYSINYPFDRDCLPRDKCYKNSFASETVTQECHKHREGASTRTDTKKDVYSCHISDVKNTRPYGYIAQYNKFQPTKASEGGWDYYRKNFISPEQVNCHVPVSPKHYLKSPPELSVPPTWTELFNIEPNTELNNNVYLRQHVTFSHDTAVVNLDDRGNGDALSKTFHIPLIGVLKYAKEDPIKIATRFALATGEKGQSYFGTQYTKEQFGKNPTGDYELTMTKETSDWLSKLTPWNEQAFSERCPCPLSPTTLPPEFQTKVPVELEGRRLHAIQMFIAWVLLLPIAMFSARYFKETYSRVFFMREFWWYTIHVLSLWTALLFMIGGVYVVKLNRVSDAPWINETWLHAIFGYILMFVFTVHLVVGPFRLWDPYQRVMQIMLHWMVGVLEYVMGSVTILIAGALPQGFLNCATFNIYLGFLAIQVLFYVGMEIQMHWVDKIIHLKPKRLYLPPPVMRLFHEDAPYSKLRMIVLILFVLMCFLFYGALHLSLDITATSCFEVEYKDDVILQA